MCLTILLLYVMIRRIRRKNTGSIFSTAVYLVVLDHIYKVRLTLITIKHLYFIKITWEMWKWFLIEMWFIDEMEKCYFDPVFVLLVIMKVLFLSISSIWIPSRLCFFVFFSFILSILSSKCSSSTGLEHFQSVQVFLFKWNGFPCVSVLVIFY